jgi:hypothetical protein
MNARTLTLTALTTLCAMGSLALANTPALAETTHAFTGSFGPGGPGVGTFSDVGGVAVDQSSGDVYVLDVGAGSVYKFDATGHPVNFAASGTNVITGVGGAGSGESEIAVDSSTGPDEGDIYVANNSVVRIYDAAGEPFPEPLTGGETCGVAVDSSGDVYVGVFPSTVKKYTPASNPVTNADETASMGGLKNICNVAVDGQGNLYAATYYGGVNKYEALQFGSLSATGTLLDEHGNTLAFDPSSDDVYIDEGSGVAQYEASGTFLERTGANILSGSLGVAAIGTGGGERLYAGDGAAVNIYGPTIVAAEPVTQAASEVERTAATLNGTVNPGGIAVSACEFEYRSAAEASFAHALPCKQTPAEIGKGAAPVAVSVSLGGLTLQSGYIYRLVATDANGLTYGAEESFSTEAAVDGVSTGSATEITPDSAKLSGSLSPDGTDAHYYFEYGTSPEYGSVSPALPGSNAGSGGAECVPPGGPKCSPVAAETTLAGLQPNTSYDYRLVAVSSFGTSYGSNEGFTTPGPPRIEGGSSEAVTRTTATLKATVDPDGLATKYRFEYGETSAYGTSVPVPEGELPAEFSNEEVSANIADLRIGTTYHFRLVAVNSAGPAVDGVDRELATVPAVRIDGEFATQVTSSSASLKAEIDPLGADTHYYIQYGFESCSQHPMACVTVPSPEGDIGAGESDVLVGTHLQGLAPATTYDYRVVARNHFGIVEAPDRSFTTQSAEAASGLPDGRAYEMVSLPNKDGAEIGSFNIPEGGLAQAAEDGGAISYIASAPVGENPPRGYVAGSQIFSTRTPTGWSSQDIATPHTVASGAGLGHGQEYRLFSPDLSQGLVEPEGATPLSSEAPANERNIYRWSAASGGFQPLITMPPDEEFTRDGFELRVAGASPDLNHVVFTSYQALTPNASAATQADGLNVYEWTDGKLQLVNVLPKSEGGQATVGKAGLGDGESRDTRDAVSDDGSLVIWTYDQDEFIYVRDTAEEETIPVGQGEYKTASNDDSRIFFVRPEGGYVALDEFDVNSRETTAIAPSGARVQGVLGASEDGSSIYFVGRGIAAAGAHFQANNLYLSHYDGTSWTTEFIATLASADEPDWGGNASHTDLANVTSRVSPDGRYLAFMSSASLTGYDNRDAVSGQPDAEVYLYDSSGAGRLVCASCDPSGARPIGEYDDTPQGSLPQPIDENNVWQEHWLAASIPGWTATDDSSALYQPRYLSDSGRLFFDSLDGLVPHDTNGKLDVYEYEPPVGADGGTQSSLEAPPNDSCTEATVTGSAVYVPAAGGCVSLISAGTESADSAFVDASANGDDVFFLTRDQLSPQDYDNSYDVYDAHACSASAPCIAPAPVSPPPCVTGDSCKPAPSPQPAVFGAPASQTFSGAGNPRAGRHLIRRSPRREG